MFVCNCIALRVEPIPNLLSQQLMYTVHRALLVLTWSAWPQQQQQQQGGSEPRIDKVMVVDYPVCNPHMVKQNQQPRSSFPTLFFKKFHSIIDQVT